MLTPTREKLGPFMSLVCFQYLRNFTEELTGRAPIIAAGRQRGYDLVEGLGLLGVSTDAAVIRDHLNNALGEKGTHLCVVNDVALKPSGGYEVRISDGACTAGVTNSEPVCAFTMGVFIGAIQGITGQAVRGVETECCACGAKECVYQIDPL